MVSLNVVLCRSGIPITGSVTVVGYSPLPMLIGRVRQGMLGL